MGSLDLERLKDAFTSLVGQAEPSVLPAFLLWVDIKVAEYKTNGYMYSDPSSRYEGPWLRFAVDTVKYKLGGKDSNKNSYGMSPDTTVQSEALELTKTPEKSKSASSNADREVPIYNAMSKDSMYHSYSPAKTATTLHHDSAYPKDMSVYSSHHSPVYGSEASGIMNLSVKSSHNHASHPVPLESLSPEAASPTPLKLTLKVPSVYSMGSPQKASSSVENSPVKAERADNQAAYPPTTSRPDSYSSLRSLLQASKLADLQPTASLLTSHIAASPLGHIANSPIKSDNDSCASSPGPGEVELKDRKENDCPYCGKKFQYRSSYRRHLKIHQGVYTHICAACSRKFTRKEHFVRHKCNRKPNIPNRSASRVELNPDAIPLNGKVPVPKVAFPPNLDEQVKPLDHSMVPSPNENVMNTSTAMEESMDSNPSLVIDEDVPRANESRRKKSMPRKVMIPTENDSAKGDSFMADIDDDMNDLMEAYDSPVHVSEGENQPGTDGSHDDIPSSPEDLSQSNPANMHSQMYSQHRPTFPGQQSHAEPYPYPALAHSPQYSSSPSTHSTEMATNDSHMPSSLPVEMDPKEGVPADTISTATGTYQIEQLEEDSCQDKCIKVTKQSNYLKLRKEAQLINGQLCFICPHCNKVFHRSSNFSRHMRIHRGVYSYICPSCNRGFYRKEHFQKHKCARKSMSRIWSRKTKLEMAADGEKENMAGVEGLEDGIDLGPDTGEEEEVESGEEGSLIVDESAGEETPSEQALLAPAPHAVEAVEH